MAWIIETVFLWFWLEVVEGMSKGKPWWVWLFWILTPLWVFAGLILLGWLIVLAASV